MSAMAYLRRELPLNWNKSLDLSAKIQLARKIVKATKVQKKEEDDEDEDEDEEEEERQRHWTMTTTASSTTTTIRQWSRTTTTTARPIWMTTTKRWAFPQRGTFL